MDIDCKNILLKVGIILNLEDELHDKLIGREILLDDKKYDLIKTDIEKIKKILSSSSLTALQQTACQSQKWPLLNLVRQILSSYKFSMKPIRKSDGYTKDGIKKYKRFFLIQKVN